MTNEQLESRPALDQEKVSIDQDCDGYAKPVSALLNLARDINPDTLELDLGASKVLTHEILGATENSLESLLTEQKHFRLAEESGAKARHQLEHLRNLLRILKSEISHLSSARKSNTKLTEQLSISIEELLGELSAWVDSEAGTPVDLTETQGVIENSTLQGKSPSPRARTPDSPAEPYEMAIKTFGGFGIRFGDDIAENFKNAKGKQLLKYLIVNRRRIVPKEELMELLWPNYSELSARNNLNVVVYSLRHSAREYIGEESLILFTDGGYQFNPKLDITTDFEEFDAQLDKGLRDLLEKNEERAIPNLLRAESLYNGPFLDEDLYVDWTENIRESYREKYIVSLESLDSAYASIGTHEKRVNLNKKILAQDNCNELAHQHLMEAYDRTGQRHLAIRQFQHAERTLKKELGVEPGEPLRAICTLISGSETQPASVGGQAARLKT